MKTFFDDYKEKKLKEIESKEYSGQFNVRMDKELHKALVIKAAQSNFSLNKLVGLLLMESVVEEVGIIEIKYS